jgi:hypothetical protein
MPARQHVFGTTGQAAALLLLAGCVTTNATLLDTSVRPQAICPDGVKVYLSADDLPDDAVQLALLNSHGDDDYTSDGGMINSQRQKAAEIGATGLVIGEHKDASAGAKFAAALFGTSKNRKGSAVAVFAASDTARAYGICRAAFDSSTSTAE